VKSIFHKIALLFWNVAIAIMTRSKSFRGLASKSVQIFEHKQYLIYSAIVAFWGFIGLVAGFILGRFGFALR